MMGSMLNYKINLYLKPCNIFEEMPNVHIISCKDLHIFCSLSLSEF